MTTGNQHMNDHKFRESDRDILRWEVERCCDMRLRKVTVSRRKVMMDQSENLYWLMGYRLWHGIGPDMLLDLDPNRENQLVVATRMGCKVRAFPGSLRPVLLNSQKLIRAQDGELKFNLGERSGHLFIKEIPEAVLTPLTEYEISPEKLGRAAAFRKAVKLAPLGPAQRDDLFNMLWQKEQLRGI